MNGAVISMWEGVVLRREAAATALMHQTSSFFDAAKADGRSADYSWYSSSMPGMNQLVVRGDLPNLMALAGTAAMLTMRAMTISLQCRWGSSATGELTEQMVGHWAEYPSPCSRARRQARESTAPARLGMGGGPVRPFVVSRAVAQSQ